MFAIAFGILASLCFAVASLLAQRGLYIVSTPWGAWITLVANTVFLLAFHFVLYRNASIFVLDNLTFVAVGLFVPGMTRVLTFRGIGTMFFFSSRRRHTRFSRDWSSDVCSSD